MKKYQIKEFSPIAPPYGGVSVFLKRLIIELNKDGYTVGGYYTAENKDNEIINSPLFDLFDWNPKWSWLKKATSHLFRIISASRNYEIIHIHGQEMVFLPAIMHMLGGQKIIITIHNAMMGDFYYRMSWINQWGFKYLARKNVQWIAVSEQTKNQLISLPLTYHNPIIVIPAYVPDCSDYEPLPESLSGYITCHNRIISFYGRSFMMHDGQDVYGFKAVIKAYKAIKESSTISIGLVLCISDDSDINKINDLHIFASRLCVDTDIFWQIGGIKGMRSLWHSSDVYIRPTYTDGDSVSIRDALAEGSVVVASNVCPRPKGVLVYEYGNDEDLLEKIKVALNMRIVKTSDFQYYEEMKLVYNRVLVQ